MEQSNRPKQPETLEGNPSRLLLDALLLDHTLARDVILELNDHLRFHSNSIPTERFVSVPARP
jgi:hypothetical protein